MIDLYTAPTPNGYKVSIMLEETGLPYNAIKIDLNAGDQKKPEFLKVNPNGKIPVIVDHEASVTLSESGAILIYLAEKSGKFLPSEPASRHKTIQWLFFQMASIGPMIGQLWHFIELDPPVHYATKRYRNEAERICKVVDTQLGETRYLAGNSYSIADIAAWPWLRAFPSLGVDTDLFPNLQRWLTEISERPAVKRGLAVPG